jgi:hypothetical protein
VGQTGRREVVPVQIDVESVELASKAEPPISYSAAILDRLAQALYGEFDVLRLQLAPALDLGLVALFRKSWKYSAASFFGGLSSLVNFPRTKGSLGTTGPQRQKFLSRVTNENGPRSGTRAGSMGRHGAVLRLRIWKPPPFPPPPPVPTPSQINWVTGRRLHALHSIWVAGVVNGWWTPIWQKSPTVA